MNNQDLEVELKVLKERQSIHAHKLKDVDECCGKLKGSTDAELKILNERIVKVEQSMNNNCIAVEKKVGVLEERVDTNKEMIDMVNSNLTKIRYLIYAAIIVSLAGLILK